MIISMWDNDNFNCKLIFYFFFSKYKKNLLFLNAPYVQTNEYFLGNKKQSMIIILNE